MKYVISCFILFFAISCSLTPERARERQIQNEILTNLSEKAEIFSSCVKSSDLFSKFDTKRIRIVMELSIDSNGQVSKFKLDEQKYPNEFSECIFNTVDTIIFPKVKNNEEIELQQPFIFSKS